VSRFLLSIALTLPVPLAALQSDADEQYRFLAGLVEKGMNEMAVEQAQTFLRSFPDHPKAPLARYRLAGALWELWKQAESGRDDETLGKLPDFEYRAESLYRAGECALARGDEKRASAAFEAVLRAGQDYLVPPALLALGEAALRGKRYDEAEQRYGEIVEHHPEAEQAPLARKALVWCAFERGDAQATVERARAFVQHEKDPALADEVRSV